jgi:hypothetical protein
VVLKGLINEKTAENFPSYGSEHIERMNEVEQKNGKSQTESFDLGLQKIMGQKSFSGSWPCSTILRDPAWRSASGCFRCVVLPGDPPTPHLVSLGTELSGLLTAM